MPDGPAVSGHTHRLNTGNLLEAAAQIVGVLAPARGFLHQLVELLHENDGLELLHPEVSAASEIRFVTLEAPEGTATVVEGLAAIQEIIIIACDGAAFAGRQMLGFLEAETAQVPERSALTALVFGEPRLARIFNEGEFVLAGDGVDRVHVAR